MGWIDNARIPQMGEDADFTSWARLSMAVGATNGGQSPCLQVSLAGNLRVPYSEFIGEVMHLTGAYPTVQEFVGLRPTPFSSYLSSPDTAIYIYYVEADQHLNLKIVSSNREVFDAVRKYAYPLLKNEPRGRIAIICSSMKGPVIHHLGVSGSPLIRNNYHPDVIHDFDHVVHDLNSKNPCGRISIFDGPPGTGKTYLVRALTDLVPRAQFLLLPSQLISDISGPTLAPTLLEFRQSTSANPIPLILVIEDADSCLVRRGADNMTAISSLLNVGDGIFGSILDLRIVATSNAGHLEGDESMDPAISRPGRLCRRLSIGALDGTQAASQYAELGGHGEPPWKPSESVTLAEVYRAVATNGAARLAKPTKKIGF